MPSSQPHVVVVGAGAFGGWTALHLRRRGARVTLLDTWGPGNSRASSGGETRIIRAIYGDKPAYVDLVARALQLWREHETRWQRRLYVRTGLLWLAGQDESKERASVPLLRAAGLQVDELSQAELVRRYPQMAFDDVRMALLEQDAGYLTARLACEAVLEAFVADGGTYRQTAVRVPAWAAEAGEAGEASAASRAARRGELADVRLADGSTLRADRFVFACGPWMNELLGASVDLRIEPTRQEVFYFGTPAGDDRFDEERCPTWIDNTSGMSFYGLPGNRWRGFKLADDTRGPVFDPTNGDRLPTLSGLAAARGYLARRFPAMTDAPLLESRVCQYEQSPDREYIIDRHPAAVNAWVVGGGSGHGFKAGPAVGELAARLVLDDAQADPLFRFARFASAAGEGGRPA